MRSMGVERGQAKWYGVAWQLTESVQEWSEPSERNVYRVQDARKAPTHMTTAAG